MVEAGGGHPTMGIDIIPAIESDKEILQNLARFYVYEFTGETGWPCPPNGLFGGCDDMPTYLERDDRYAFLLRNEGELAGFVLVKTDGLDPESEFYMGDFFILRKFQRQGVGRSVARRVLDMFRGEWEICFLVDNTRAMAFWKQVVDEYTRNRFKTSDPFVSPDGYNMVSLRFLNALPD
jgi:predicted acetyltransferase